MRGAVQLFSFTYAIAWYDLCIYIQIIRYGVTVLQITVRSIAITEYSLTDFYVRSVQIHCYMKEMT